MTKKIIASFLLLGTIFSISFVSVQAQNSQVQNQNQGEIMNIQEEREQLRQNIREERQVLIQNLEQKREQFRQEAEPILARLKDKDLAFEEREQLRQQLREKNDELRLEAIQLHQETLNNAQQLRQNFRQNILDVRTRAQVAVAHGKGLRMLNRFRAAITRFDHILVRLETRAHKMEAEGIDISSVVPLLEEAKILSAKGQSKLEELEARYESLLEGENSSGIGKEAGQIAQELKAEIEQLHEMLKEILFTLKGLVSEEINPQSTE